VEKLRRNVRSARSRLRVWVILGGALALGAPPVIVLRLAARSPAPRPSFEVVQTIVHAPADDFERFVPRGRCPLTAEHLRARMTDEESAELAKLVARWIEEPDWWSPAIVHQRGVVHVESAEDRGDEPPYPASAAPEAERVCGSAARWMRSHVRDRLDVVSEDLRCDGNVCCYAGMEYRPSGFVAFGRAGGTWSLDAWVQLDNAGLSDEIVEANIEHVTSSLARLDHTSCRGEPAGYD
jgi:hypothetical protein